MFFIYSKVDNPHFTVRKTYGFSLLFFREHADRRSRIGHTMIGAFCFPPIAKELDYIRQENFYPVGRISNRRGVLVTTVFPIIAGGIVLPFCATTPECHRPIRVLGTCHREGRREGFYDGIIMIVRGKGNGPYPISSGPCAAAA